MYKNFACSEDGWPKSNKNPSCFYTGILYKPLFCIVDEIAIVGQKTGFLLVLRMCKLQLTVRNLERDLCTQWEENN